LNGTSPRFLVLFGLIALPAIVHRFIRPIHVPRNERLVHFSAAIALGYAGVLLVRALSS
jgi:hypothetical protein